MSRLNTIFLIASFLLAISCKKDQSEPQQVVESKPVAAKLSILVVEDPGIAEGLKILRGEWAQRSGGQLNIEQWTKEQFLASSDLTADLIIYPSRYVGTLVERNQLRPIRKSVVESDDVAIGDMFPLIRNVSLRLGNQTYALSLGEPPLLVGIEESQGEIDKFSWMEISNPDQSQSVQLEYPHAVSLLVRGVAYSRSSGSVLFDPSNMQPLLAAPPFVKALQELVSSEGPSTWPQVGGELGWPCPASSKSLTWKSLPAAVEVYNPVLESWEPNASENAITFLGFGGRSISVTRGTRNSSSAFKLLRWLVRENIAAQLSSRSDATLWFRKGQVSQAKRWLSNSGAEGAVSTVNRLLSSERYFVLPRIPHIDEYLQVLDDAVQTAITEVNPAYSTLSGVVQKWNFITDRAGRDKQLQAYRRHLGLDDSVN